MKLTRRLMMVALVVSCLFSSAVFGDVVGKIVVNKQADSAMQEPMEQLTKDHQVVAYKHHGFWQCMDTLRDKKRLEKLWESGKAPWKLW